MPPQAPLQTSSPPPQSSTELTARAYAWVILFEAVFVPVLFLIIMAAFILILAGSAQAATSRPSPISYLVVTLIFAAFMVYVYLLTRCPIDTKLAGSMLTTRRLFGEKSVDLAQLTRAKPVLINFGYSYLRNFSIYGLQLTDAQGGKLILHLGSLPTDKRELLWRSIRNYIEAPKVVKPEGYETKTINKWIISG